MFFVRDRDYMDVGNDKRLLAHVWVVCALGLFIDGYDLYISSVAEPFINALYHPTPFMIGLIQAAAPIGAAMGALLIGRVADKIGRKSLLILNLIFFVIIALLSACAWDVVSLCVFRFLIGFGVGADYPICAAYLAEMIPKNKSRQFIAAAMFINCLASPVGVAVAWLMFKFHPTLDVWRWMFASGAIPAVIALLLRAKLPESFVWKVQKQMQQTKPFFENYQKLFSPSLKKTTICLCLSWFFLDISYYGIGLFAPAVLRAVHIAENADLLSSANDMLVSTLFVNAFVVLGAFSAIFVIAKMNPFKLQKIGFLVSFLGLLILSFSNMNDFSMPMIFSGFILFNFFVNFGPGITTYLLPAELYATEIKATGHGVAASCGKMGAAVGTLFLPVLQFYIGIYYTVGLLAMTLLVGWILTHILSLDKQQEFIWKSESELTLSK
jgi:putative MFS transporter